MRRSTSISRALAACVFTVVTAVADAAEWSGYASIEPRIFFQDPQFPAQPPAGVSPSAVFAPQWRKSWNAGRDRITLAPFLRWDADDSQRTHWDLREALWQHAQGPWIWQVGVGRVFWGVTEARHLVDIVNQTDWVEDIDEEDKLGQPMLAVERWTPAGRITAYLLPWFRPRPFPGADARLRGRFPVATNRTVYASGAGRRRLDLALRWFQVAGNWDLGLSAFHGTSREPQFLPGLDERGQAALIPRYDVISQLGADVQHTRGAWLWKTEAIARRGYGQSFLALDAGLEYTFFGVGGSDADVGLIAEYLYDGRNETAPPTIYDDDWMLGMRFSLNDIQNTSVLLGAVVDGTGSLAFVEAERRVADHWTVELEARLFIEVERGHFPLDGFRNDSYFTIRLSRFL